jgi:hypothetical protein
MAILNPTDVICEIDRIVVRDDGETVGGSEPYLWSIFFKIDGDPQHAVTAAIDINNQGISLKLDGEPFVASPDEGSHGNLAIEGGSVDAGGWFGGSKIVPVPAAVGRFRTTLTPIPTTITIDSDSWIAALIDDAVISVQEIIDWLSADDACPSPAEDPSEFFAEFGAEFVTDEVGGMPGAFGALYLLMDEDSTSESAAEDARRALRDGFREELKNAIMPAISFSSQVPSDATQEEIRIRLTQAVTDAIVAGIDWFWVFLGFLTLGWLGLAVALDQDDPLGSAQAQLSHIDIALGIEQPIDQDLPPSGHGDWSLRGRIGLA